jgi:endonuclease I
MIKNLDMRKTVLLFILSLTFAFTQAQIPAGYYDAATGTGYTLKTQLHNIIDGHTSQTYDALWTHFQTTDVDNYYEADGSPLDMYSENPLGSDPYNWTFVSDQCGNYSGEGSCYNREHSFPKSWFNDGYPMYTDLFHLYLTDGYVNGIRGNYPFGEVGTTDYVSQNGSKRGTCSYPGYSGTVFEPIDEFKGDFARSYFYMATRYEDVISGWPGSDMLNSTSDQVFTDWALNMLLEWHTNDPVSDKEIDRNDAVYGIQGNRNPFIDHPEYVNEIWGGGTIDPEPSNQATGLSATAGGYSQIDLSWTDAATGTQAPDGYLIKIGTTDSFADPVDGTDPSEDTDLSDGTGVVKVSHGIGNYSLTGLSAETTYYFKMWSYTNSAGNINFKVDGTVPTANATTDAAGTSGAVAIQDFDGTTPTWSYTGDGAVDAAYGKTGNGYRIGGTSSITLSSVDISAYSSVKVYISDASAGGIENADALEIFVNVDGAGFPTTPDIKIQESNPTDGTYNVSWDYSASNTASTTAGTPITVNGDGATGYANVEISIPDGSSTVELKIAANNNNSDEYYYIDDIKIEGEAVGATPTLVVSPTSLSGFTYAQGSGPSATQSFTVSGTDLDGSDVTLTAPVNYEISTSDFSATNPITLSSFDGTETTIYVRLKSGLSEAAYNGENIIISGGGDANGASVTCNGEVTAGVKPEPTNHVADFGQSKSVTLSWENTETPDNYLIMMNTTGCGDFLAPVDGTTYSTSEYLKIVSGTEVSYQWSNLSAGQTYYFVIVPFNGAAGVENYKTDGTIPCVQKDL